MARPRINMTMTLNNESQIKKTENNKNKKNDAFIFKRRHEESWVRRKRKLFLVVASKMNRKIVENLLSLFIYFSKPEEIGDQLEKQYKRLSTN